MYTLWCIWTQHKNTKIGFKLQPNTLLSLLLCLLPPKLCRAEHDVEPEAKFCNSTSEFTICGNTKLIQSHGAKSKPNTKHRSNLQSKHQPQLKVLLHLLRGLVWSLACSAPFFSRNSVFLSQHFSQNSVFQPLSAKLQTSERGHIVNVKRLSRFKFFCQKIGAVGVEHC